jgi:DNA-binding NarL/FixJ family response regulator
MIVQNGDPVHKRDMSNDPRQPNVSALRIHIRKTLILFPTMAEAPRPTLATFSMLASVSRGACVPTRILVADDHDVVRRGLRAILERRSGYEVVAEARDGPAAVEAALQTSPDVAIIDYSLPGLNGLEVTRRIRQGCPKTQVLIFTMHESETVARGLLAVGARGYLVKSDAEEQLTAAIQALSQGRSYFTWKQLKPAADQKRRSDPKVTLSPREREVVQLIAEGHSNRAIASQLKISVKTVETHRGAAMHKAGLYSTADIVRYAVRNTLVVP